MNCETTREVFATQKNPLLIDIPLSLTIRCLSFEDIKKCRLVCQQWNRNASSILRDRTKITFKPQSRLPETFLEVCENSQLSLFKSFVLKCPNVSKQFKISELQFFFEKWGANIQYLHLQTISLYIDKLYYDVTPWLVLSPNIKKLTISFCKLKISLESLRSIPSLELNGNVVKLLVDSFNKNRLTPEEITWSSGVTFKKDEADMKNAILNNFFDFSRAKKITVKYHSEKFHTLFDLGADIFDARIITLEDDMIAMLTKSNYQSGFINWGKCSGKVDILFLIGTTCLEPNNLKVKILLFGCLCKINLNAIPRSAKKIKISTGCTIVCTKPMRLPNLTFLGLSTGFHIAYPNCISEFRDCENLFDLEFDTRDKPCRDNEILNLKLQLIPKSVKRLKIGGKINIEDVDDTAIDVDVLILKNVHSDHIQNIISKINTKFLVLSSTNTVDEIPYRKLYQFIDRNVQLEKIAVGIHLRQFYFQYTHDSVTSITENEFKKIEHLLTPI